MPGPGTPGSSGNKYLLQSAEIKCGPDLKFLILMMPTDTSVPFFIQELQKHDCRTVVRACESKYSLEPFTSNQIEVKDLPYRDGTAPTQAVINQWIEFLQEKLTSSREGGDSDVTTPATDNQSSSSPASRASVKSTHSDASQGNSGSVRASNPRPPVCIAIHCVAGLGRAPVLVAIAMLEYGMKSLEVVEVIRSRRRGAINQPQLDFLTNYKSKKRLKPKKKKKISCSFFGP